MPERTLPADHQCALVEVNTAVGIWRCACGRAYRYKIVGAPIRAPEHDHDPLLIDGSEGA